MSTKTILRELERARLTAAQLNPGISLRALCVNAGHRRTGGCPAELDGRCGDYTECNSPYRGHALTSDMLPRNR